MKSAVVKEVYTSVGPSVVNSLLKSVPAPNVQSRAVMTLAHRPSASPPKHSAQGAPYARLCCLRTAVLFSVAAPCASGATTIAPR